MSFRHLRFSFFKSATGESPPDVDTSAIGSRKDYMMPSFDAGIQAEDYERMSGMVTGFWVTQIVRAAAWYSVADHLARGTDTAEGIAAAEGTDPGATRRLMRTCAALGLMTSADGTHFTGTSLLGTLQADVPNSLRYFALSQTAPGHWLPWGRFPEAVRTGEQQVSAAHGEPDIFAYFAKHQDEASMFTESMSNLSLAVASDAAAAISTKGVGFALDVGGAAGDLIRAMMRANPELHGGVLDLPHIVPDAELAARKEGLGDRFTAVPGDFFKEIPPADLYVLKYILHDWDDERCVRILSNCRASLAESGRVVIVDLHVGDIGEPGLGPVMDMNMLDMTGGMERQAEELDKLFAASGLRRVGYRIVGAYGVTEAVATA
jgi:hypothetical protein